MLTSFQIDSGCVFKDVEEDFHMLGNNKPQSYLSSQQPNAVLMLQIGSKRLIEGS